MEKKGNKHMSTKYWLQEYNERGHNWIDYLGFSSSTTLSEAVADLESTKATFKPRKFRLIVRTDAALA